MPPTLLPMQSLSGTVIRMPRRISPPGRKYTNLVTSPKTAREAQTPRPGSLRPAQPGSDSCTCYRREACSGGARAVEDAQGNNPTSLRCIPIVIFPNVEHNNGRVDGPLQQLRKQPVESPVDQGEKNPTRRPYGHHPVAACQGVHLPCQCPGSRRWVERLDVGTAPGRVSLRAKEDFSLVARGRCHDGVA